MTISGRIKTSFDPDQFSPFLTKVKADFVFIIQDPQKSVISQSVFLTDLGIFLGLKTVKFSESTEITDVCQLVVEKRVKPAVVSLSMMYSTITS